jgi:hypothetical protein
MTLILYKIDLAVTSLFIKFAGESGLLVQELEPYLVNYAISDVSWYEPASQDRKIQLPEKLPHIIHIEFQLHQSRQPSFHQLVRIIGKYCDQCLDSFRGYWPLR